MDWKRFYARELASTPGRAALRAALARHAGGDRAIEAALRDGGVASFPHVTVHDAADPVARVVQTVLAMGARRVVALGVLHGGTLPAALRETHRAMHGGTPQADDAFRRLGGAFLARGAAATPDGAIGDGPAPARCALVRDDPAVLQGEFSLDLFLAALAAAARDRGVRPPPVTRLFVSATRSPRGDFDAATALAAALGPLRDADTACVATGDLVHIGHGYTPADELATVTAEPAALQAALRPQIDAMHEAALARRDFAAAWTIGTRLRSDQRALLPLIAELVGAPAHAELLSLHLADYARINGVPAPCFVAAALCAVRPGARAGGMPERPGPRSRPA